MNSEFGRRALEDPPEAERRRRLAALALVLTQRLSSLARGAYWSEATQSSATDRIVEQRSEVPCCSLRTYHADRPGKKSVRMRQGSTPMPRRVLRTARTMGGGPET